MKTGVNTHRFTEQQAREDLQIALWYGYACMNIDEYPFYYRGVQWMRDSRECRRLRHLVLPLLHRPDLLRTPGGGAPVCRTGRREEPDYPWIWLQLGKLRSHFGDRAGALAAADRGLELVPGDYEFTTLRQEIEKGATL